MAGERERNQQIIDEFRANGGQVGGHFEGRTLLLLHSTGARSGAERVNPLMCLPVDGGYAVFATNSGYANNPGWYYNLRAVPTATIEVGTSTIAVTAREAEGGEREFIWSRQIEVAPAFAELQAKTSRLIPVVVLEPLLRD
jgi:deazaflavin-dependent oxidoreductase (nitroreductase family)